MFRCVRSSNATDLSAECCAETDPIVDGKYQTSMLEETSIEIDVFIALHIPYISMTSEVGPHYGHHLISTPPCQYLSTHLR